MFNWFDLSYLLLVFIPTLLLSLGAQLYLGSAYKKWSKVRNSANWTGAQVGNYLISQPSLNQGGSAPATARSGELDRLADLRNKGIINKQEYEAKRIQIERAGGRPSSSGIRLERTPGQLTDHYDPRSHTVRMSDSVATQPSVVAMAVVAHELGHAQQHQQGSALITMRNVLVPAVRFSPQVAYLMIFLGLVFNAVGLMWIGILFYGLMVVFAFLTLPVEIDASRRGLRLLHEGALLKTEADAKGSRQVLNAAGATYLAAAITALLQLLYYVSMARRRR